LSGDKVRLSDTLLGLLAGIFGVAILWHIRSFPDIPGHYYGPGMFPRIVGWGFVIFGVLLLVRVARQAKWKEKWITFPEWSSNGKGTCAAIGVLIAIQAYGYLGEALGFQLLSVVVMSALFLWAGRSATFSISLAIVITLVLDALFSKLLRVPLPTGVLSQYWW
jgi:putative tricarboxylic transport membrane protein